MGWHLATESAANPKGSRALDGVDEVHVAALESTEVHRLVQVRFPNRLEQISRHIQLLTTSHVSTVTPRSEHYDGWRTQLLFLTNLFDQSEPVRTGHMHIRQDQSIRAPSLPGCEQFLQGGFAAVYR